MSNKKKIYDSVVLHRNIEFTCQDKNKYFYEGHQRGLQDLMVFAKTTAFFTRFSSNKSILVSA